MSAASVYGPIVILAVALLAGSATQILHLREHAALLERVESLEKEAKTPKALGIGGICRPGENPKMVKSWSGRIDLGPMKLKL